MPSGFSNRSAYHRRRSASVAFFLSLRARAIPPPADYSLASLLRAGDLPALGEVNGRRLIGGIRIPPPCFFANTLTPARSPGLLPCFVGQESVGEHLTIFLFDPILF